MERKLGGTEVYALDNVIMAADHRVLFADQYLSVQLWECFIEPAGKEIPRQSMHTMDELMCILQRREFPVRTRVAVLDFHVHAAFLRHSQMLCGPAAGEILTRDVQPFFCRVNQPQRLFVNERLTRYAGVKDQACAVVDGGFRIDIPERIAHSPDFSNSREPSSKRIGGPAIGPRNHGVYLTCAFHIAAADKNPVTDDSSLDMRSTGYRHGEAPCGHIGNMESAAGGLYLLQRLYDVFEMPARVLQRAVKERSQTTVLAEHEDDSVDEQDDVGAVLGGRF